MNLPCFSRVGTAQMLRGIVARAALGPGDLVAIEVAISMLEAGSGDPLKDANEAVYAATRAAQRADLPQARALRVIALEIDMLVDAAAPVVEVK